MPTTCTPPALGCTTYSHDAWGHVISTTDPLGNVTTVHYDANGNKDSVTDANNNTTTYTYNAANELVTVTRSDTSELNYDYWDDGKLHHQYDAANNATTYTYDAAGRVSTVTDPNNRTTTYTYDLAGNRIGKADHGGSCTPPITTSSKCTTYTYDAANQLTDISYSDGTTPDVTDIAYDDAGQRVSMTDGTGTSTWEYDSLGRLVSHTNGASATIGYDYNLRGLVTEITYPGSTGAVTRDYDDAGRLSSVTDWLSNQFDFEYNADSMLVTQTNPNGTTTAITPDNANRIMSIEHAPTASLGSPFATFDYTRDDTNRVDSVTSVGVPSETHAYDYNTINQLTDVDSDTYDHDTADNLILLTSGATQQFDTANQLCWTSPTGATGA